MNLDEIRSILELVREHDLAEFELEHEGIKIRIKKDAGSHYVVTSAPVAIAPTPAAPAPPAPAPPETPAQTAARVADEEAAAEAAEELELAIVKSPIVGTFYRSPEPGASSFVEIGDTVRRGQVLCIIEAMKLMNEIESEYEGEIMKVYVENGQPVQYGERLFAVRTR